MSRLQDAYDLWRIEPFPPGSEIDELDSLHAELAYADAMVADSAIPLMTEGRYSRVPDQAVRELDDVVVRASRLQQEQAGEYARLAGAYKKYAELLMAVCKEIEDAHGHS